MTRPPLDEELDPEITPGVETDGVVAAEAGDTAEAGMLTSSSSLSLVSL